MLREAPLKFTRELPATLTIRSVGADGVRINDQLWSETVALTPEQIVASWKPAPLADLTETDFKPLLEHAPELVIVGSGATNEFPPRQLMFSFARLGIGLEVMDTAAAARTFNVLAGEGRRVAAVLYPTQNS